MFAGVVSDEYRGVFHKGRCFHFVLLVLELFQTLVDMLWRSIHIGKERTLTMLGIWVLSLDHESKKLSNLPGDPIYCARLQREANRPAW